MFIATGAVILLVALLYAAAYPRTKYAPGYSEAAFRGIRAGMTTNEVRNILGEPLYEDGIVSRTNRTLLAYSEDGNRGPLGLGWRQRAVEVVNGIVVEKTSQFVYTPPWNLPDVPFGVGFAQDDSPAQR